MPYQYRPHEHDACMRVWDTSWPHDAFEILTHEDFESLLQLCAKYPALLVITEADED